MVLVHGDNIHACRVTVTVKYKLYVEFGLL